MKKFIFILLPLLFILCSFSFTHLSKKIKKSNGELSIKLVTHNVENRALQSNLNFLINNNSILFENSTEPEDLTVIGNFDCTLKPSKKISILEFQNQFGLPISILSGNNLLYTTSGNQYNTHPILITTNGNYIYKIYTGNTAYSKVSSLIRQ